MTSILKVLVIATVAISVTSFSDRKQEGPYALTVKVNTLRNSDGNVQFALYNKDGSIPDEHYKNHFRLLKAVIKNGSAQIIFQNIPAGTYAVNILHDENNNNKIDRGFILPKEGIGFSNYKSIGIGNKPSFAKASFVLQADTSIVVKVIYM